MQNKRVLIFLLVMLVFGSAPGQEGWLIPFGCAFEHDIKGFNEAFIQHHLPPVSKRLYGWGLELRSPLGGNILFGPLYFRTKDRVQDSAFQLYTETWGFMGEVGFQMPVFRFLSIVPMLGIGGVQPSFHLRKISEDIEFDSLLLAPGRIATISPGTKLTGLAAIELGLMLPSKAGRYGLGLRGGYLYSPFNLDWHLADGARVTKTPKAGLRGLWVSLGIIIIPAPEVVTE